jgi:hypothetical protein
MTKSIRKAPVSDPCGLIPRTQTRTWRAPNSDDYKSGANAVSNDPTGMGLDVIPLIPARSVLMDLFDQPPFLIAPSANARRNMPVWNSRDGCFGKIGPGVEPLNRLPLLAESLKGNGRKTHARGVINRSEQSSQQTTVSVPSGPGGVT